MPIYQARSRGGGSDEWIAIHSNGIHTYPLEWTAAWIALVSNASPAPAPSRHPPGEKDQRVPGCFHYNSGNATNHPEVRTMPSCVAGGAELEPPVRTPHTVYVKSLYRIAGQDYCRHHIIRAAVAAGVITEIRASAGPVVALPRE